MMGILLFLKFSRHLEKKYKCFQHQQNGDLVNDG